MSLLSTHIEQISLSAQSIATLPFPPAKIFTNALLAPHDITTLIRDTEPHERALFSVPPPPPPPSQPLRMSTSSDKTRRQTVFNVSSGEVTAGTGSSSSRVPRRQTAVAAVLGGELHAQIKRAEARPGDLDVEVLLQGAEKLGAVYPLPGAKEEIARLRARHQQLAANLQYYENKVEHQRDELEQLSRGDWDGAGDANDEDGQEAPEPEVDAVEITEADLLREEEEIRQLERKKKVLEDRVSGMERDLGGLRR